MSYFFHRNPIKSTVLFNYEVKSFEKKDQSSKICSELRLRRGNLLKHLELDSSEPGIVEQQLNAYLALFYGFVFDVTQGQGDALKDSKLRNLVRTTWGNSTVVRDSTLADAWFEVLNMVYNVAIWLTKHAAYIAAKDDVPEAQAKVIHSSLRKAAGMFEYIKTNSERLIGLDNFVGSDFNAPILNAYRNQSIAEAQEVTIARSVSLKHAPTLISKLATEVARIYGECYDSLEKFDPNVFGKWIRYFQLKHRFYTALAYAYLCESLLVEDNCGLAVRTAREGLANIKAAKEAAKNYAKAYGPGPTANPEKLPFFQRVKPMLEKHLEKAEKENNFIYHQPVPEKCPPLEAVSAGLAKPEPFVYPARSDSWTEMVYNKAFDLNASDCSIM